MHRPQPAAPAATPTERIQACIADLEACSQDLQYEIARRQHPGLAMVAKRPPALTVAQVEAAVAHYRGVQALPAQPARAAQPAPTQLPSMRRVLWLAAAAVVVAMLAACGGGNGPDADAGANWQPTSPAPTIGSGPVTLPPVGDDGGPGGAAPHVPDMTIPLPVSRTASGAI
jgi:hypothetical protein